MQTSVFLSDKAKMPRHRERIILFTTPRPDLRYQVFRIELVHALDHSFHELARWGVVGILGYGDLAARIKVNSRRELTHEHLLRRLQTCYPWWTETRFAHRLRVQASSNDLVAVVYRVVVFAPSPYNLGGLSF